MPVAYPYRAGQDREGLPLPLRQSTDPTLTANRSERIVRCCCTIYRT